MTKARTSRPSFQILAVSTFPYTLGRLISLRAWIIWSDFMMHPSRRFRIMFIAFFPKKLQIGIIKWLFLAPVPGPRRNPEGEPEVVVRQTPGDRRTGQSEGLGTRGCRLVACPRLGTRGPGPGRETGRETVADTNGTVTVPRPSPGRSVASLDSAVPRETR